MIESFKNVEREELPGVYSTVKLEDMKVASICDLPMGPQKVGSWFDGLMH